MTRLCKKSISITPLKQIRNEKGDIYHALRKTENSFSKFGEAYFSTIIHKEIKGWKKHNEMVLNLVVPVGSIRFVMFDDRDNEVEGKFTEIILSQGNYCRLTVPSGIWMAFQGLESSLNLLLNIASIEHDPKEAQNVNIDQFKYDWSIV